MRTPTKEEVEQIVKDIIAEYRPVTMAQAIHNAIWFMVEMDNKEKAVDLKSIAGSGKELFDGIRC